jgi:hypothetical protein
MAKDVMQQFAAKGQPWKSEQKHKHSEGCWTWLEESKTQEQHGGAAK